MIDDEIKNIMLNLFDKSKYRFSFFMDGINVYSQTLDADEYLLDLKGILSNFVYTIKKLNIDDVVIIAHFYEDSDEYKYLINFEREVKLKYGDNIHTQIEYDGCEKTLHIVSKNIESNSLLNDLKDKFIKEAVIRKYFSLYCITHYF